MRTVPLVEVKGNISTALQRQTVADRIQQIQKSVTPVLNDAYFGAEKPVSAAPPPPQ